MLISKEVVERLKIVRLIARQIDVRLKEIDNMVELHETDDEEATVMFIKWVHSMSGSKSIVESLGEIIAYLESGKGCEFISKKDEWSVVGEEKEVDPGGAQSNMCCWPPCLRGEVFFFK